MKIRGLLFLLGISTLISVSSKAQTGCLLGGRVYYQPTGTTVLSLGNLSLSSDLYNSGASYGFTPNTCPAWVTTYLAVTPTRHCATASSLGIATNDGALVTYNSINCPIDDYAWILVFIAGGVGFTHLRKKAVKRGEIHELQPLFKAD